MDKIRSLIKTDLNITFGLSALKYKFKNKRDRLQIIILSIALLSLIPTYIMLIKGLSKLYLAYMAIGQKTIFLLNGFIFTQLIVLILGIIFTMSKYYFSNDLNILVPLPIKPKDIIGAKFVTLMVNEYLTSLPIILPFIFIYGLKGGEGVLYWLYSLILILFVPVIPLALISIIVMLFMKYTNIKGRKDLLRTIGYIILLVVLLGFQFKMQSITQNAVMEEDFFLKMAEDSNLLVRKLGLVFPPSMWGALTLSNYSNITGLFYLILFVAVSIFVFLLMLQLSEKIFFSGLIGGLEISTTSRYKKLEAKDYSKSFPVFLSIGLKEIRILFREPIYLMNSVMGVLILPILILMSSFMKTEDSLSQLNTLIENNTYLISLIGAGIVALIGSMNAVGCTTFSREGKNLWIQRVLPIKPKDQIFGRILSSIFVQIIAIIALIGSLSFIVDITVSNIFWITVLGLLGSIVITEIGMIVDIFRPLLDWDNPQKAMKQNINVLIAMGLDMLYLFGIGFLVYKLLEFEINLAIIYGVIGLIFLASFFGFYILLKNIMQRQFQTLE